MSECPFLHVFCIHHLFLFILLLHFFIRLSSNTVTMDEVKHGTREDDTLQTVLMHVVQESWLQSRFASYKKKTPSFETTVLKTRFISKVYFHSIQTNFHRKKFCMQTCFATEGKWPIVKCCFWIWGRFNIYVYWCFLLFLFALVVSNYMGFGLMDALKMVTYAKEWTRVPEQQRCEIILSPKIRFVWNNKKILKQTRTAKCLTKTWKKLPPKDN